MLLSDPFIILPNLTIIPAFILILPSLKQETATMVSSEQFREFILNQPALEPPLGIQANFIDPPTIRSQMLGVIISMLVLSTIVVAVRLYTKLVVVKKLALEDCKDHPFPIGSHLTFHIDLIASAWVQLLPFV